MVKTIEERRDEAMQTVNIFRGNDWDLKEETPEYFLLTRSKEMSWLMAFVLFCLWIIPGIIYIAVKLTPDTKKVYK